MKLKLVLCLLIFSLESQSQIDSIYQASFNELKGMLTGDERVSFKRAVFVTENAYFENKADYVAFNATLNVMTRLSKAYRASNSLLDYKYSDSLNVSISGSLFRIMKDTVYDLSGKILSTPFEYDFEDAFAEGDWTKMFVFKLLKTRAGNCHSLPFLYKILCEEQGVKAYLAFAPNHIYIKQRNKKDGWYNTELTSGMFPIDAWVMASGYVSTEAIKNGIYMDTLSDKQSIAVCLVDLARGYERRGLPNAFEFIQLCCNTALKYYPNYAEGLLYKAESLKKYGSEVTYKDMEKSYVALAKLGYREIPDKMYDSWINSLKKDREKYENKKINNIFNSKSKQ